MKPMMRKVLESTQTILSSKVVIVALMLVQITSAAIALHGGYVVTGIAFAVLAAADAGRLMASGGYLRWLSRSSRGRR